MRACLKLFVPELYDRTAVPLSLTVRMLKAEMMETLLYGCVTWTLRVKYFAELRTAHYPTLFRVNGIQRRLRTDHTTFSYAKALKVTRYETIETIIRERPFFCGGRGTAKLGAIAQLGNVRDDGWWGEPEAWRTE